MCLIQTLCYITQCRFYLFSTFLNLFISFFKLLETVNIVLHYRNKHPSYCIIHILICSTTDSHSNSFLSMQCMWRCMHVFICLLLASWFPSKKKFLLCQVILEFLEENHLYVRFRDKYSESESESSGSKWAELVKITQLKGNQHSA